MKTQKIIIAFKKLTENLPAPEKESSSVYTHPDASIHDRISSAFLAIWILHWQADFVLKQRKNNNFSKEMDNTSISDYLKSESGKSDFIASVNKALLKARLPEIDQKTMNFKMIKFDNPESGLAAGPTQVFGLNFDGIEIQTKGHKYCFPCLSEKNDNHTQFGVFKNP